MCIWNPNPELELVVEVANSIEDLKSEKEYIDGLIKDLATENVNLREELTLKDLELDEFMTRVVH